VGGFFAYDVLKLVGFRSFTLKFVLLWIMHDFLGYGTIVGVAHQGYVACPFCGLEVRGEHSIELGKQTST
jgi:hypothetical protein